MCIPPGQADGANNPGNAMKAKQTYGSRIWLLQGKATAKDVLEEKNAFQACHSAALSLPLLHMRPRGWRASPSAKIPRAGVEPVPHA